MTTFLALCLLVLFLLPISCTRGSIPEGWNGERANKSEEGAANEIKAELGRKKLVCLPVFFSAASAVDLNSGESEQRRRDGSGAITEAQFVPTNFFSLLFLLLLPVVYL